MRSTAALAATLLLLSATPASAIGDTEDGNYYIAVPDPAYVSGDLWASSAGVFATIAREHHCWYPQGWWDDAVVSYEDGAVLEYNTGSRYFETVQEIVSRIVSDPSETRQPHQFFSGFDVFADRSCIQAVFVGRDDCSTDDMIGVLSTAAVRDAYRRLTIETGSFDDHDIGGLYCLVVIERDPWLELVEDEALIPEPVRATFPQFRTLVGLENSVWYEVAPGENATAGGFSVGIPTQGNDYTLNLSIWLTGIRFDIDGDGDWEYDHSCLGDAPDSLAPCVGSAESPVFTFEYEARAFHAFTMQTVWAGQAVGPTGEILNIDPGLLFNEYTFDWETVEVRSSLDE
jgi:hypothetical protein